ncbi:hypothetical protein B0H16DRAFT_1774180 [Mycena metata]|uniref:DUF6534 domain-containing protein n=1 Tax=Mycena metata TaxID=1033252 RepID=A0AAD7JTY0_9AGAR|nr:hypothetical protein B0H16DRAFT_1774180 [Mycena metata]
MMAANSLINLSTTLGAVQVGALICCFAFGVLTCQVHVYFSRFPTDSAKLKTLVVAVWVMQLGEIVCVGLALFTYTIFDYGHPETVVGPLPKSFAVGFLHAAILTAFVQGFLSYRLYTVSRRLFVPVAVWVAVFVRFIGNVAIMATSLRISIVELEMRWGWLFTVVWGRRLGQRRTAALLDKLIVWTLETGMLTSANMIAEVVCFYTMKDNFIWTTFLIFQPLLYSNSLLASLNSRATLRAMNEASLRSLQSTTANNFANMVHVTPDTEGRIAASSKMSHA